MTSPVKVYNMGKTLYGAVCDQAETCQLHFKFEWLNPEAVCAANFVCTKLDAMVCEEYGIFVTYTTAEGFLVKNQTVCEPFVIHDGTIGVGQKAVVTLWFKRAHEHFNADCFFWCTHSGQLPNEKTLPPEYTLVKRI